MEIRKNGGPGIPAAEQADLEQINALARTALTAEEGYTFSLRLCDNEVDRDGERFSPETLRELAPLFVGKSGIFDHCWSARGQTARIYSAEVVPEPGRVTAAGDESCYLKARAYMLRTEQNRDLIAEIEAGIKKEVSVGCSVREAACSICGAAAGTCEHVKGQRYGGKLCYTELQGAEDAYEWSFVAVPAQRRAGVVKAFGGEERLKEYLRRAGLEPYLAELADLEREAALGRSYMKGLRRDVLRSACAAETELDGRIFAAALEKLDEGELKELLRVYRKRAENWAAARPQLPYEGPAAAAEDGSSAFLI